MQVARRALVVKACVGDPTEISVERPDPLVRLESRRDAADHQAPGGDRSRGGALVLVAARLARIPRRRAFGMIETRPVDLAQAVKRPRVARVEPRHLLQECRRFAQPPGGLGTGGLVQQPSDRRRLRSVRIGAHRAAPSRTPRERPRRKAPSAPRFGSFIALPQVALQNSRGAVRREGAAIPNQIVRHVGIVIQITTLWGPLFFSQALILPPNPLELARMHVFRGCSFTRGSGSVARHARARTTVGLMRRWLWPPCSRAWREPRLVGTIPVPRPMNRALSAWTFAAGSGPGGAAQP